MKTKNTPTSQLENFTGRSPLSRLGFGDDRSLITYHYSGLAILRPRQGFFLIPLVLICFAFLSNAQAVSPPPDGGYPGGNTAEGQSALLSRTTGSYNTAVGFFSLLSDTTGSFNTAIGAGSLFANSGDNNTATGTLALFSNTMGSGNTGSGFQALFSNQQGGNNTACGYLALDINIGGNNNTALGAYALAANSGSNNIGIGYFAGQALTFGSNNIAIGSDGGSGESGTIRVGRNSDHTATFIAGIAGQTVGAGGSTCYVDNAGKLGVFLSARRF